MAARVLEHAAVNHVELAFQYFYCTVCQMFKLHFVKMCCEAEFLHAYVWRNGIV